MVIGLGLLTFHHSLYVLGVHQVPRVNDRVVVRVFGSESNVALGLWSQEDRVQGHGVISAVGFKGFPPQLREELLDV